MRLRDTSSGFRGIQPLMKGFWTSKAHAEGENCMKRGRLLLAMAALACVIAAVLRFGEGHRGHLGD